MYITTIPLFIFVKRPWPRFFLGHIFEDYNWWDHSEFGCGSAMVHVKDTSTKRWEIVLLEWFTPVESAIPIRSGQTHTNPRYSILFIYLQLGLLNDPFTISGKHQWSEARRLFGLWSTCLSAIWQFGNPSCWRQWELAKFGQLINSFPICGWAAGSLTMEARNGENLEMCKSVNLDIVFSCAFLFVY